MAYNYQSFATLGVNLNRQNYGSLDISQVFTSQADLNYYMSKGALKEGVSQYWLDTVPYPYAGQYVALVDNATRGVTPYILTEKEDGTFEATKLGVPEVDGETIIINEDGKLEAVIPEIEIPEYTDTNTTYKLSVTATTEDDSEQGVKITLTPYDGETAGTPQSFIIADPDLSDYITLSELETALAKKVDKDSVYTKSEVYTKAETDAAIGKAVSEADHLKRKIVGAKEDINVDAPDAMQYIYMVPSGLTASDNKYYEYIVLEDNGTKYVEQVGNWEVDLKDYLTVASAEETYAKKNDVANTYATKAEVADTLKSYSTTAEITDTLEGYVTDQELTTTLSGYATKTDIPTDHVTKTEFETALDEKIDKTEGAGLITDAEKEKLAGIEEGAEKNVISSVTEQFTITDGELSLNDLVISDIVNLTETLENINKTLEDKVDKVYYTVTAEDGSTSQVEGTLLSPGDKAKLDALTLDDGDISISGSVEAAQVKNLDAWITEHRNSVAGLLSTENEAAIGTLTSKVSNIEEELNNYVLASTYEADMQDIKAALTWKAI